MGKVITMSPPSPPLLPLSWLSPPFGVSALQINVGGEDTSAAGGWNVGRSPPPLTVNKFFFFFLCATPLAPVPLNTGDVGGGGGGVVAPSSLLFFSSSISLPFPSPPLFGGSGGQPEKSGEGGLYRGSPGSFPFRQAFSFLLLFLLFLAPWRRRGPICPPVPAAVVAVPSVVLPSSLSTSPSSLGSGFGPTGVGFHKGP